MIIDKIALILTIVGALNWGSIGLFQFDIVAWICGGPATLLARIIYTVVALAGIWCMSIYNMIELDLCYKVIAITQLRAAHFSLYDESLFLCYCNCCNSKQSH